jgi:hypothetical protein
MIVATSTSTGIANVVNSRGISEKFRSLHPFLGVAKQFSYIFGALAQRYVQCSKAALEVGTKGII